MLSSGIGPDESDASSARDILRAMKEASSTLANRIGKTPRSDIRRSMRYPSGKKSTAQGLAHIQDQLHDRLRRRRMMLSRCHQAEPKGCPYEHDYDPQIVGEGPRSLHVNQDRSSSEATDESLSSTSSDQLYYPALVSSPSATSVSFSGFRRTVPATICVSSFGDSFVAERLAI